MLPTFCVPKMQKQLFVSISPPEFEFDNYCKHDITKAQKQGS